MAKKFKSFFYQLNLMSGAKAVMKKDFKYQVRAELDKTLLTIEHLKQVDGLNRNEIIEELWQRADQLALELSKYEDLV